MTLRPIPGAPVDAPVPDFPAGDPGPLVVPESRFTRYPVSASPSSVPPPELPPARRTGPVEIRGVGDRSLTFRCIPEIPAINRSSMIISIAGERAGDHSTDVISHLHLATDQAKAFLLALRDGDPPIVVADSRTGVQVEFVIAEDGPVFIVGEPGQECPAQRFDVGSNDVKTMAAHLLAELGP